MTIPEFLPCHGLWPSSLWCKFWVSGLNDAEQLVSSDNHSLHLKEVVVFCKSTIQICFNALMVMSPHILTTVTDPFQYSLSPEVALLSLQEALLSSSTSSRWFVWSPHLCLNMWHSLQRQCPYQSWPHSPLTSLSWMRPDLWYSLSFPLQFCH